VTFISGSRYRYTKDSGGHDPIILLGCFKYTDRGKGCDYEKSSSADFKKMVENLRFYSFGELLPQKKMTRAQGIGTFEDRK